MHNRARAARRRSTGTRKHDTVWGGQTPLTPREGQGGHTWGHGPRLAPRVPRLLLGSMGGRLPEAHCHQQYCTYRTNTWDHRSDGSSRNHVKRDTELCMQRGREGRGKQIDVFLAGTGGGIVHPGHNTRTTTSDMTATPKPWADRDSHMDNHGMHQHWMQRERPDSEQANRKAANTTIHRQKRGRSQDPTANAG